MKQTFQILSYNSVKFWVLSTAITFRAGLFQPFIYSHGNVDTLISDTLNEQAFAELYVSVTHGGHRIDMKKTQSDKTTRGDIACKIIFGGEALCSMKQVMKFGASIRCIPAGIASLITWCNLSCHAKGEYLMEQ